MADKLAARDGIKVVEAERWNSSCMRGRHTPAALDECANIMAFCVAIAMRVSYLCRKKLWPGISNATGHYTGTFFCRASCRDQVSMAWAVKAPIEC